MQLLDIEKLRVQFLQTWKEHLQYVIYIHRAPFQVHDASRFYYFHTERPMIAFWKKPGLQGKSNEYFGDIVCEFISLN